MALSVSTPVESPYGSTLTGTYWRWVSMQIDVKQRSATVILNGYVDATAFSEGKQWIGQRALNISGADFLTIAGTLESGSCPALSTLIYDYAKANDSFFTDATDS